MARQTIHIERYSVGDEYPPFIVAEAGVHHYNSLELAKTFILNARLAGAQAIKFQTYKADRLAARWAPTYWDSKTGQTQYDIFAERSLLSAEDYHTLIEYARQLGIIFLSTPFDIDSASLLHELGMPAFKIASADINFIPLLRRVAGFGKPILLSTGASTLDEVQQTVRFLAAYDVPLALLHCNLTYPTALRHANLSRIIALRHAFPTLVIGYSDHTQPQDSELTCPLSVALGARIIEKHYTLNKALEGDDHYHAVDQDGLIRLVKNCQEAYLMTTNYMEITEGEQAARIYARRSVVARHPLSKGSILTADDVDYKRPGTGVSPHEADQLFGQVLARDIATDELILPGDVVPSGGDH